MELYTRIVDLRFGDYRTRTAAAALLEPYYYCLPLTRHEYLVPGVTFDTILVRIQRQQQYEDFRKPTQTFHFWQRNRVCE